MTDAEKATKRALAKAMRQLAALLEEELAAPDARGGPRDVVPADRPYSETAKAKALRGLKRAG